MEIEFILNGQPVEPESLYFDGQKLHQKKETEPEVEEAV